MATPNDETMTTVEAREHFSDLINRAAYGKARVVLTRRGKALVAVVPVEDVALLQKLEDHLDVEAAREALKEPGSEPWEAVKARLGL
jgi:prevent-host-death family protein